MRLFAIAAFVPLIGASPVSFAHQIEQMLTCRSDNAAEDYSDFSYPPLKALFPAGIFDQWIRRCRVRRNTQATNPSARRPAVRVDVASGEHIEDNQSFAITSVDDTE